MRRGELFAEGKSHVLKIPTRAVDENDGGLGTWSIAGEAELKQFALTHGPPVQHPRRVFFKPELPLTGTNKIDRRVLAEEAAALSRG